MRLLQDETGRFRVHEHPILDSKLKLLIVTMYVIASLVAAAAAANRSLFSFCLLVNLAGFIVQLYVLNLLMWCMQTIPHGQQTNNRKDKQQTTSPLLILLCSG
jgi:protein-S-isoprenylcysteine O-methyltransferase Ste14